MNTLRLVLEGLPLALVSVPRRELAAFCEQLARASPRVAELVQGLAHLPVLLFLRTLRPYTRLSTGPTIFTWRGVETRVFELGFFRAVAVDAVSQGHRS
jgi:hypothetical protein